MLRREPATAERRAKRGRSPQTRAEAPCRAPRRLRGFWPNVDSRRGIRGWRDGICRKPRARPAMLRRSHSGRKNHSEHGNHSKRLP